MSKRATDAKVIEYLWPSRRLAQRERAMKNPRMTSVGIAAALLLFSALLFGERAEAGSDINREDYPSYKAYLDAVSASNADHIDQMEQKRRTDCAGVPYPAVGETLRTLYCAGAESAGSSSSGYGTSSYYKIGSSFYIVESGRITYVRHY
jgi:hypothetical protein